jgi:hypothetical protein
MKKQLPVLVFLILFSVGSFAQTGEGGNWGGGVDDDPVHFGFTFQYIASEYKVYKKRDWQTPKAKEDGSFKEPLQSISSSVSPGFGLGFVSDFRLGDNANLRFTPTLVFTDRVLNYTYPTEEAIQKKLPGNMVEFPLGIKLKSNRRLNFRAYLLAGGKYSMDIVSKKKTDDANLLLEEKFVKNNKSTVSYDIGIGFDFYFEYFKLSPEIKLSNSLGSVLNTKDAPNPFTSPLDKLFVRNFQFSLFFE